MKARALYCPVCGRRYLVAEARMSARELLVLCGACGATFEVDEARSEPLPSPALEEGAVSVLVAHESPSVCNTVARVVRDTGLVPRVAHEGGDALAAFDRNLPDTPRALVLDVGIPGVPSFEVISSLRAREALARLPVVLLASVFDPTRYKRRPSSLHGADAYLELHHVPDRLPGMLRAWLDGGVPEPTPHRGHLPREYALAEALRIGSALDASTRAHAVARRIVSDLALYNEPEIVEGIAHGDLEQRLGEVLAEGRRIYDQTVAGLAEVEGDPYGDAVQDLIAVIRRRSNL